MRSTDGEKFVEAVNADPVHAPSRAPVPAYESRAPMPKRAASFVWRVVDGLQRHHAASAAPAMAFHFFLSLIPVLVLAGFVLGLVVRQRGVDAILGPALEQAPDVAEAIARRELERLAGAAAAPLAPLSIVGFMWLAATGTHGLMDVLEIAVSAPPRSWWKQRAMALAWVAAGLVVVALLGWTMLKADSVLHPHMHLRPHGKHALPPILADAWERFAALCVLSIAAIAMLAAFFRFSVEHAVRVRRRAFPGAFVAFASWLVVSWGFGEYASSLASYTLYYGSLAAVAVLIVWLYLASWALLLGVEVNAQLEGLRSPRASLTRG